jgi:hypothetical protein
MIKPTAFATQATRATLAKEHAQRAQQASTNLQQAMVIARTAVRASSGWKQEDPMKHRARPAARASTGLLQDKPLKHCAPATPDGQGPLEAPAQRAGQEGTRHQKGLRHASNVPRVSRSDSPSEPQFFSLITIYIIYI